MLQKGSSDEENEQSLQAPDGHDEDEGCVTCPTDRQFPFRRDPEGKDLTHIASHNRTHWVLVQRVDDTLWIPHQEENEEAQCLMLYHQQKKQCTYGGIPLKDFQECNYFHFSSQEIQKIIYQQVIKSQLREQREMCWPRVFLDIQLFPFCTPCQFIIPLNGFELSCLFHTAFGVMSVKENIDQDTARSVMSTTTRQKTTTTTAQKKHKQTIKKKPTSSTTIGATISSQKSII